MNTQDYTIISDLPQSSTDQLSMLKNYLADNDSESESDDDYDMGDENSSGNSNWQHYYGGTILILLAVILYYIIKIRKEITGMYEE